jgi:hypothetical protein
MANASVFMGTPALTGQFLYRSFRNGPITVKDGEVALPLAVRDVFNPEMGWLIWKFIRSTKRR